MQHSTDRTVQRCWGNRYTAPLPLTAELYRMGPAFYTRATCIPEETFKNYADKVELVGTFAELDTIGIYAFSRQFPTSSQSVLIKAEFPRLRCVVAD